MSTEDPNPMKLFVFKVWQGGIVESNVIHFVSLHLETTWGSQRLQKLACAHRPIFCIDHCLDAHKLSPFHHIQRWTGTFFEDYSLRLVCHVF